MAKGPCGARFGGPGSARGNLRLRLHVSHPPVERTGGRDPVAATLPRAPAGLTSSPGSGQGTADGADRRPARVGRGLLPRCRPSGTNGAQRRGSRCNHRRSCSRLDPPPASTAPAWLGPGTRESEAEEQAHLSSPGSTVPGDWRPPPPTPPSAPSPLPALPEVTVWQAPGWRAAVQACSLIPPCYATMNWQGPDGGSAARRTRQPLAMATSACRPARVCPPHHCTHCTPTHCGLFKSSRG